MQKRTSVAMVILALSALAPTPAVAQTKTAAAAPFAHGANGSLVVDGKKIALSYAYAIQIDDAEGAGLLMAGPRNFFVIVLTDRPLPLTSFSDRSAPQSELKSIAQAFDPAVKSPSSKMFGVMLRVDAVTKKPFHADFFYPGRESISMSIIGMEIPDKVSDLKVEKDIISGTATLALATETHADKGPKKYKYRVAFQCPLIFEPPITQVLDGKMALDCAPAQALRAYFTAAHKGDLETMRSLTMPSHLAYLKNSEIIASMKKADVTKMADQVRRVVVRGNKATVVIVNETPSYSTITLSLARDNGIWKMFWP